MTGKLDGGGGGGEGAFNIDGEAYAKVLWPIRGADRKSVCLECREQCCELK